MTSLTDDDKQVFAAFTEIGILNQLATSELQHALGRGLNVSEFGVMSHLVRRGDGETPTHMAKAFQMAKPSMTAILAKLERKGLAQVATDEKDRRVKRVAITDKGRQVYGEAAAAMTPAMRELADLFGMDRLRDLNQTLVALRQLLDERRNQRDGLG